MMLTYHLKGKEAGSLYDQLYRLIREDILTGRLAASEKLPSRRTLAKNLGISTVTVETAYGKLEAEGYIYSLPKRGFYVSDIDLEGLGARTPAFREKTPGADAPEEKPLYDLSGQALRPDLFPFTAWSRCIRSVMADRSRELLERPPGQGLYAFRAAIADYLLEFRGMEADPSQIVVGAGTEYLYGLLLQLLGRDLVYALEDPGYTRIGRVYAAGGVEAVYLPMDRRGIRMDALKDSGADVLHISPAHHFPTGIVMPVSRRSRILTWAMEEEGRYIIEDDYDSELRSDGRPLPTLFSADSRGRVIYMNTFTRTLSPTIRVSYMVLPPALADRFRQELGFYSCTVSNFTQYTLTRFIETGAFGSHINRMRRSARKLREKALQVIREDPAYAGVRVLEEGAGLHFLLETHTGLSDEDLVLSAAKAGIRVTALSDYCRGPEKAPRGILLVNYAGLSVEDVEAALTRLGEVLAAAGQEGMGRK